MGADGLIVCQTQPPNCVLLDHRLPDLDGREFLTALASLGGTNIPVIVLTRKGNETIVVDVMKAGAADYMPN
jgi:DNA-binding response OmpR family regulator